MDASTLRVTSGLPYPLGATPLGEGVNFAVLSQHATAVHVSLFDGDCEFARFILPHRVGDVHCGLITGLGAGQRYGLRAEGPYQPETGHFFDPAKLLADPYATRFDGPFAWHPDLARHTADTTRLVPKCIVEAPVTAASPLPPGRPRMIYEVAVKAFTRLHPDLPPDLRGSILALAHPSILEYLGRLGVDAIELMPVAAWIDERHLSTFGLRNAWGYNPVNFFAPDPRLAPGGLGDVRKTVAALHGAGIRVILDVVFNHTGESDLGGPTICLRGLDNALYYRQAAGLPVNDTGCGNTLALDHPAALRMVMDALRHWVHATGVDGFRYDLATVMGRMADGFSPKAPLLAAIEQDPVLAPLIHIAEPWDIGPGGYQLGAFPARWLEWNDRYRDDVRRFWRGDEQAQGGLATRLAGSSDIFASRHRTPACSINFVAAHDGFTLADTVRYDRKHNHANGEANRDGSNHETSWVAADPVADARALLATLFLSRGTPMLTAGDEFGRTQGGNNNAYAQDNETTWLDWEHRDRELADFVSALLRFRTSHHTFFADAFLSGTAPDGHIHPDAEWFAVSGEPMDETAWNDPKLEAFALCLATDGAPRLLLWFNRAAGEIEANLPPPQAAMVWGAAEGFPNPQLAIAARRIRLAPRAVTVLAEHSARHKPAGTEDTVVDRLAAAAGIAGEWWEVDGTHHRVSIATKTALLAAMGFDLGSASAAREALQRLVLPRRLPAYTVANDASPVRIAVHEDRAAGSRALSFSLTDERGMTLHAAKPAGHSHLELPPLAPGYYELREDVDGSEICHLLVAPPRCFLPDHIAAGERVFGLSAHLYALRDDRDAGIGDFATLGQFLEVTAQLGGDVAGINPLHHMFPADRTRVSPYQPSDRRFLDPVYIDVPGALRDLGLPVAAAELASHEAAMAALRGRSHVDYAGVWRLKAEILRAASDAFFARGSHPDFDDFITAAGQPLRDHAAHEAGRNEHDRRFVMWLQWLAERQLAEATRRGRVAGLRLGLYRDLALGCAYEGGEVQSQPGLYATAVSLGAPPDPFAAEGQVWNLPPHVPPVLRDKGFRPFIDVLRASMRQAGVLRIDHILGFARQFWIPRGASAAAGAYVTVDTDALIALTAIESHRGRCMVIGEDLGTVPEGLRQRLAAAAILSYRMLWFERDQTGYLPAASYPPLSAACLSSHDTRPFRGWRQQAGAAELRELERALNAAGHSSGDLLVDVHGFLAEAPAAVMLVQADDLTGETEPLNVPGTDAGKPNWRRRLSVTVDKLAALPATARVLAAVRKGRITPTPRNPD
jgi:glycogen operon protein